MPLSPMRDYGCICILFDTETRGLQVTMGDRTAAGAVEMITTPEFEAMVIGAHPDDNDFGPAATSALWASQGKKIVWVVMTDGSEGSEIPDQPDEELMLLR